MSFNKHPCQQCKKMVRTANEFYYVSIEHRYDGWPRSSTYITLCIECGEKEEQRWRDME